MSNNKIIYMMKNLFKFFSSLLGSIFGNNNKVETAEVNSIKETPAEAQQEVLNKKFPKNIEELRLLVRKVYDEEKGAYDLLLEYMNHVDEISVNEFKVVYEILTRDDLKDELADVMCEKVKKNKDISYLLTSGRLGYYLERFGFSSIIGLFDYKIIKDGTDKEASIRLLEETRVTTCWRHYEDASSRRAYIKYFSFGDGKDLLKNKYAIRFLGIIDEYHNKFTAKKLVEEGKMSESLYKKIYK